MKNNSNFWVCTIVFILSILLVSCSCKDSTKDIDSANTKNVSNYEKIAAEKYKSEYSQTFNKSKSFVLVCSSSSKKTNMTNEPFSFFVYNIEKDNIVYEQSLGGGSVEWINDTQIEVSPMPGIVKGNEEENQTKYIYDISIGKKINKMTDK